MPTLGDRVKKLREENNMSQIDVAKRTGISRSNIGKIENNLISPNCNAVAELARLFNVTTDWLILGESLSQSIRPEDAELLAMYHALSRDDKLKVEGFISALQPVGNSQQHQNPKSSRSKNTDGTAAAIETA